MSKFGYIPPKKVPTGPPARVVKLDEVAIYPTDTPEQLREKLDGMVLYVHALSVRDGEIIKTLGELNNNDDVVLAVTLHTKRIP